MINIRSIVLEELLRMKDSGESHEMAAAWISERLQSAFQTQQTILCLKLQLAAAAEAEPEGPIPPEVEKYSKEMLVRATVRTTRRNIAQRMESIQPMCLTHRHRKRGTSYREISRGRLQSEVPLVDNAPLVAYVDLYGDWWFRPPCEFDNNSRFIPL